MTSDKRSEPPISCQPLSRLASAQPPVNPAVSSPPPPPPAGAGAGADVDVDDLFDDSDYEARRDEVRADLANDYRPRGWDGSVLNTPDKPDAADQLIRDLGGQCSDGEGASRLLWGAIALGMLVIFVVVIFREVGNIFDSFGL